MPVEELAIAYQFVNSLHPYAKRSDAHKTSDPDDRREHKGVRLYQSNPHG